MATKIQIGLSTYLVDFAGGQAGFRTPPYVEYATDHGTNYVTLRNTINQLVDEVAAIQGPNAALGVDILVFNDPARGSDALSGVVGHHSYFPTITTVTNPNDAVAIAEGAVLVNGVVARHTGATKAGSGLSGTRWIAVDNNGAVFLETAAGQRALDLYTVNWNGSAFTGSFTRLIETFFDGDDYEDCRKRTQVGTSPISFAAQTYDQMFHRFQALERMLAGFDTDAHGNALGQPALRLGSQGTPGLAFNGDPNTGLFSGGGDTVNVTTGGTSRLQVTTAALVLAVVVSAIAGTAGAPAYSFTGDLNTGMFQETGDTLGLSTAGNQAVRIDPTGNVDLILNSRVKGVRSTAQSIADNTPTLIDFNAADAFDVGAWHDHASGTLSVRQEFTCPAGGDGLYSLKLFTEWAAPTQVTDFTVEITVNGTPLAEKIQLRLPASGDAAFTLTTDHSLVATDVVRARVTQNDTVGAAALDLQAASLSIVKVA